jgi:replication-associated recombination protein RarA
VDDLFESAAPPPLQSPPASAPLADRMRPRTLDEVIGQEHLVGPGKVLRRALADGALHSMILWGPPGTGKTTIARLLADAVGMRFVAISAVFSGVADLKKVFAEARDHRKIGKQTLLFVDEIHRFNRAQQDGFLPYVEDGTVVLVGATTENPSFELNAALLSRAQVLILNRLDGAALGQLLDRAEALVGRTLPLTKEAREALIATKRIPTASASRRAMLVLPVPGGPHRIMLASLPAATMRPIAPSGPVRCSCPMISSRPRGRSRSASGASSRGSSSRAAGGGSSANRSAIGDR